MVAEMEVQMVANIEVDKVADKVADMVADKGANMVADKKIVLGWHVVAHDGRQGGWHGKYISHKSDKQYFLKQYFCISSIKHLEKRSKFETFSVHSISTSIWPTSDTTCGSVQRRLQSLYDEVKIRRHVDKIYYLCLLKLFYFFFPEKYISHKSEEQYFLDFFIFHQNSATMWHHL